MNVNRRVIYWAAVFAVLFFTFLFGYLRKSAEKPADEKIVPVEVQTVKVGSIEETIELTGWIKANAVVDVKSKVAGRIESLQAVFGDGNNESVVAVEEGLAVKKGQQLCIIDHDVYLAELAAGNANVRAREVELADAERERRRIVRLYEGGSATEQNKDKAVTAAELAAARLALARATSGDLICAAGSVFVIAEVMEAVGR